MACLLVGGGRTMVRRAKRATGRKWPRRTFGWALMIIGLVFMILGVLLW
jgi:hypothetical protein